jgi:hypothetical protein
MRNESIPWNAVAVALTPPPFNEDTPFRITTDASPDGCPQLARGQTVHLHMTGGNIRGGICHLPDYPTTKVGDRIPFVETCFQWAPTLKRMTAAARLAFAIVSTRRALDAIGGVADGLLTRIYDIVEPRAIYDWEGVCARVFDQIGDVARGWVESHPDRAPLTTLPSRDGFFRVCGQLPDNAQICLNPAFETGHRGQCAEILAGLPARSRALLDGLFLSVGEN